MRSLAPPMTQPLPPDENPESVVCHLADIMQVVMRVGVLMLRSGTVSFRVEQAMNRTALALGAERLDAYVTLTGIIASIHVGDRHYTQIARIKQVGVDMNCLSAVEALANQMPASGDSRAHPDTLDNVLPHLLAKLDKIETAPPVYPLPLMIGAVAIACGAFSMLNGGGWFEWIAATLGAGVGQTLRVYLQRSRLNPVATTVICAAIAILVCHYTMEGLAVFKVSSQTVQAGFLASVLFLVPGMPLVTAALDLVRSDLHSGIARATYALVIMFSVAIGILLVLPITGISIL